MMQGLNSGRDRRFVFSKMSRLAVGHTQSPVECLLGVTSPGVKWPWHEADHLLLLVPG